MGKNHAPTRENANSPEACFKFQNFDQHSVIFITTFWFQVSNSGSLSVTAMAFDANDVQEENVAENLVDVAEARSDVDNENISRNMPSTFLLS